GDDRVVVLRDDFSRDGAHLVEGPGAPRSQRAQRDREGCEAEEESSAKLHESGRRFGRAREKADQPPRFAAEAASRSRTRCPARRSKIPAAAAAATNRAQPTTMPIGGAMWASPGGGPKGAAGATPPPSQRPDVPAP